MDGWMSEKMNGWMDGWMDDEKMNRWMIKKWMDG